VAPSSFRGPLPSPEIHDVSIDSQPNVIGQVPAVMVGVGIDHDVVAIPEPVVGIVIVVRRNLGEEAADVESVAVPTVKAPDVLLTDPARKASVFPRMIEMIVGIVASGIVSHPLIVFRVDVRGFGMTLLIAEAAPLIFLLLRSGTPIGLRRTRCGRCRCARGRRPNRSGTASRNMSIAHAVIAATLLLLTAMALLLLLLAALLVAASLLGESGDIEHQRHCQESDEPCHICLRFLMVVKQSYLLQLGCRDREKRRRRDSRRSYGPGVSETRQESAGGMCLGRRVLPMD
jgi:hypothetical protein